VSAVHTIRLRDPWEVRALPDGNNEYRRKFGKPRIDEVSESVWLICPEGSRIHLNGQQIEPVCDVTGLLLPRNEVAIVLNVPLGEVQLEIRSA